MELIKAHSSNFRAGRTDGVKYICIHSTGNRGDTARNNAVFFSRPVSPPRSAHYFVDERESIQSVRDGDTAWAVGDGNGRFGITNSNSISIEMCNSLTYNPAVEARTIALVRELLKKYPNARVAQHFDASRKNCPTYYVENPKAWENFMNQIKGGLTMSQYEELKKEIASLKQQIGHTEIKYNWVDENMPEWARPTIGKMHERKLILGNEKGELMLSDDLLRIFTILDRAGVFGQ